MVEEGPGAFGAPQVVHAPEVGRVARLPRIGGGVRHLQLRAARRVVARGPHGRRVPRGPAVPLHLCGVPQGGAAPLPVAAVTLATHRRVPIGTLAVLPRVGRRPPQADAPPPGPASRAQARATEAKDLEQAGRVMAQAPIPPTLEVDPGLHAAPPTMPTSRPGRPPLKGTVVAGPAEAR